MAQATFFEQKAFSPTSLTMVIGIHAALIAAAVAWKIDVILPQGPTDTEIYNVPMPKVPPNPPKPKQPTQPQEIVQLKPVESVVDLKPVTWTQFPPVKIEYPPLAPQTIAPTEPIKQIEQGAKAKGNVQALIGEDDYPDIARRNEETGTVRARLDIGSTGKVTGCTVVVSSGSTALDSTTCRILKARARFTPAKDSNGQAVADSYTTPKITWRLTGEG